MAALPADVTATAAVTTQTGRGRRGDGKVASGFMAPSMLGLLAFTAFPIVASLLMGFYNWPVIGGHTFNLLPVLSTTADTVLRAVASIRGMLRFRILPRTVPASGVSSRS